MAILHWAHISAASISAGRGSRFSQLVATSSRQVSRIFMDVPQIDIFQRWFNGGEADDLRACVLQRLENTVAVVRKSGDRETVGGTLDAGGAGCGRRGAKTPVRIAQPDTQQGVSVEVV